MVLLALGFTQAGCQKEGTPENGSSQTQLLTSTSLLRADVDHVRQLAARSATGSIQLDLADDAQYRFLRARVSASGKTPDKFPQFFSMIDSIRQRHLARKKGVAMMAGEPNQPKDHLIGSVLVSADGKSFEASAFSTIQNGSDYSFLDVIVWNENQSEQLSDYGWGEVYGDGRKLWAQAKGPLPTRLALADSLYVDSASIVSVDGQEEAVFTGITTLAAPGCNIIHPQDLAPNPKDGIVTICLDRNYGDCDYPLVGRRQVQIPLQGSMTFGFPVLSINKAASYAKLVEEGGGPHEMTFGSFADYLQIDPTNPARVTWSIPQHLGVFDGVLFTRYQDVDLFLSISVELNRNNRVVKQTAALASTPSLSSSASMTCLPKIQTVWSCLAEGTQIEMADGKTAPVESITKGTHVVTDNAGVALNVVDTSVGIERIPMVRLEDDAGHDLLLTASHPVVTPDRGVVWAEELSAGQKVLTDSGVSTLVKAGREMYHGTVYNLKLDTSKLTYSRYPKGSTMYANGFLVGDLAMQRAYEFKNSPDYTAQVFARLPAHWRNDYQNSLEQGSLTARR
ncbi:Hint domain-containing protein [Hyalangium gracile]|uniref:Hint domain-containing protein n=1 Tax=Hyalangium gracile TaxID=394092 RepID=UPI001CCA8C24|nr:Hint domain-containing protein [Hyalangium gracile]